MKPYYESAGATLGTGVDVTYVTQPGGYHPAHWHDEIEILYHLNGESDITIDKERFHLKKRHMIVVDSRQVHSTYTDDYASMFVCIHISKEYMAKYIPGLEYYSIRCTPSDINDENFKEYLEICNLLKILTEAYIKEPFALNIETEGLVLLIFAHLIRTFGHNQNEVDQKMDVVTVQRIHQIISYVQEHYMEEIRLQDIAGELGLGREYFCRFFKKNMGISFLQYLNEVRVAHIYQDLERTDMSISQIMDRNGFTNQKLCNKTFKEIYGKTPSDVRKGK